MQQECYYAGVVIFYYDFIFSNFSNFYYSIKEDGIFFNKNFYCFCLNFYNFLDFISFIFYLRYCSLIYSSIFEVFDYIWSKFNAFLGMLSIKCERIDFNIYLFLFYAYWLFIIKYNVEIVGKIEPKLSTLLFFKNNRLTISSKLFKLI